MNKALIQKVLFPAHEMVKQRQTLSVLNDLALFDFMSRAEIEDCQLKLWRKLLDVCLFYVPYYGPFLANLNLTSFALSDLPVLPLLTKKKIRQNKKKLRNNNCNKFFPMSTGGSTGDPLRFFVGLNRIVYDKASRLRFWKWWGIEVGDREVVLWGAPHELKAQNIIKRLRDRLFNSILLSAHDMSRETLRSYVGIVNNFKPSHFYAYAGAMYILALYILRNKCRLKFRPKVIFATGEKLYDYQREAIEKAFGCPVAVEYGAREVGLIAHECPQGSLHINETIYLENTPETESLGKSSLRELVATNLISFAMPFLRYKTGDLGLVSGKICPCGRESFVLENIIGRSNDFLVTKGGKIIHSSIMNHIFREIPGIELFQVVQKEVGVFDVRVCGSAIAGSAKETIKNEFRKVFGPDLSLSIKTENNISLSANGKHKYVVSHVASRRENCLLA